MGRRVFFFFLTHRRLTLSCFSFRSLSRSFEGDEEEQAFFFFSFASTNPLFFFSPQEPGCVARPFASLSGASSSRERWNRESNKRKKKKKKKKTASRSSSSSSSSSVSRRLFCSLFSSLFLLSFPFSALLAPFSALSKAENTQSMRQIGAQQARGELKRSKRNENKA